MIAITTLLIVLFLSLLVVRISGFADLPDDDSLQWDLLRKPFNSSELEECISEAVQRADADLRSAPT